MIEAYSLNRAVILDRLGGDEEIFDVMVDMFLQDAASYAENLAQALSAADIPLLQREAHTVKGVLATFADEDGAQAAYAIEQQCKQGSLDGLAEPVKALQARLAEVAVVLSQPKA